MIVIHSTSSSESWIKVSKYLLEYGTRVGNIIEELNLMVEITQFKSNNGFDEKFREVFGDDRIDYASSISFVEPKRKNGELQYNHIKDKWYSTYWGRMIKWGGEYNQIENVIKILKNGKSVKRCELVIYEPKRDSRNPYSQPCLMMLDLKPRDGKLYLTSVLRSNRVSKSGYADYDSMIKLGKFLSKESGLKLEKVSILACSSHLGTMDGELKKTKELLLKLDK
jgi:thymidylate synthase